MATYNDRPIIFALSNPTSKAECTAQAAYTHTAGKAVFASGSPFDPVTYNDHTYVPGQANNAYVFPGIGLGVVATGAKRVTDDMFAAAAATLSREATDNDLAQGCILPPLHKIRSISLAIAVLIITLSSNLFCHILYSH